MLQLGIRGLGIARFKFNPISWFLKGEPGAWYDPSDLTTLFQDSAGTTPMSAVGTVADQPVGLMLDKSKGLALGAELVTNGDFSNGTTGWAGPGTTVVGGELVWVGKVAGDGVYQTKPGYKGGAYKITVTVKSISSGAVTVTLGIGSPTSSNCFNITSAGTYSFTQANNSADDYLRVYPVGTSTTATIDNISVKQIAGNHAFQGDSTSTPAKRPMLSARVNLLTKTEDFSDAVWQKSNGTIGGTKYTAPNGTLTANKLVESLDITAVQHNVQQQTAAILGVNYTSTIYLKAGERNKIQFQIQIASTPSQWTLDFTTGIATNTYGGWPNQKCSATLQDNGWYKLVFSGDAPLGGAAFLNIYTCNNLGNNTYIGDGTSGTYIWGADLRPTNAGALLPPYQRVNTASDYDTVGFPLYLKANGTSSAMSTNSIDFTATDKMTVVTGVRKLSDATIQIALELSAIADSNNGTFLLAPSFNGVSAAGAYYSAGAKGTSIARVTSGATYVAPISNINTFIDSISTPYAELKINGTQVSTNTAGQGLGNFGNYPLYLFARAGTSLFLNGQFYGAIIRGAQSDTASVTQTENYMATKTGITF